MARGFVDLAVVLDGSAVACWVASIDLDFYNRRRPHSSLDGATHRMKPYFTRLPPRLAA